MEGIVVAFIGLVAGMVGSLIAPWVHWGVEKTRIRQNRRMALIDDGRAYVNSREFGVSQFARQAVYSQLKDHLDKILVSNIDTFEEQIADIDNPQEVREMVRQSILDEIKGLERKWKLI